MTLIFAGIACRYRLQPDGRRQLLGLLLPRDLCDGDVLLMKNRDCCVNAIGPVQTVQLSCGVIEPLLVRHPPIARAFWLSGLVDDSITREWVVNVGKRTASERMAHLFCETHERLRQIGLARGLDCDFPLTQAELGDALALSSVHVNRVLMNLRRSGLVTLRNQLLTLHDIPMLQALSGFDPRYRH